LKCIADFAKGILVLPPLHLLQLPSIFHYFVLVFNIYFTYEGVAVGSGWQGLVAYINVACYYFVGLPVGALLGFKLGFGVKVR
jgi:multidrug resistance protein, MATE family